MLMISSLNNTTCAPRQIAVRVFHTCHCNIHVSKCQRGVISFNCLSFAKYWVIKQGSDSLDN